MISAQGRGELKFGKGLQEAAINHGFVRKHREQLSFGRERVLGRQQANARDQSEFSVRASRASSRQVRSWT
jgi:hypothetical protein